MQKILERADVYRILHDQTLAHVHQFFLHTNCLNLSNLSTLHRKSTAKEVLVFFNLDMSQLEPLEQAETLGQRADIVYEAIQNDSTLSITFRTSGSTGTPCNWTFSAHDLSEEAESLSCFFAGIRRVIAVTPVHHVYGFAFSLMLPKRLEIASVHHHPLTTADFFRLLQPGDLIIAFPLFWSSALKMSQNTLRILLPGELRGVTSGAPCPPDVIEGLLTKNANADKPFLDEMTEIYGATEFGAVGIRRDCRASYTLLPHWERIQVRGESGPAGEPAEWGICRATGKQSPLPDIVEWMDERHFVPVGRKDKAVQVSSINVYPAKIAKILCGHPKVYDCVVRLMRPEEGDRLKAFIVPRDKICVMDRTSGNQLRLELKTWLAERLDAAEIPKSITFGDVLPRTTSGKATDWPILSTAK